jgi:hypothetical protein
MRCHRTRLVARTTRRPEVAHSCTCTVFPVTPLQHKATGSCAFLYVYSVSCYTSAAQSDRKLRTLVRTQCFLLHLRSAKRPEVAHSCTYTVFPATPLQHKSPCMSTLLWPCKYFYCNYKTKYTTISVTQKQDQQQSWHNYIKRSNRKLSQM